MPPGRKKTTPNNGKRLATQQSVDQAIWSICDIMRRGNCAGAMQYVPELTWILFLRILDERECQEKQTAEAQGIPFKSSLEHPYTWSDWAAPNLPNKRAELMNGPQNTLFNFVNTDLLPYLKALKDRPDATPRQKVISQIISGVERIRIDTERNFLDVLDKVDALTLQAVDDQHTFALSQPYEGLLLKMGEKGNDGGQFFTPREVIRAIVQAINPQVGETIYDPSCGTGGFLAQSFEHILKNLGDEATADQLETLKQRTFWGREKENLIYPIALANLILHGIDKPNLWHGNTLTGTGVYEGLFEGSPAQFDVILSNPPFGGKEGKEAKTEFDYKTGSTQVLFLQHILRTLKDGGRCGIVLDEGLLFRTNEEAFVKTKRKLLDDCNLWCVLSLPGGVFTAAGAGVKTNLLFFTKGQPTRKIWYYDLSDLKVRKKSPLTFSHFQDFFQHLPIRANSDLSWTVDLEERKKTATTQAQPLEQKALQLDQQAAQLKLTFDALKRVKPRPQDQLDQLKEEIKPLLQEAKDLKNKAQEIRNAVYDLKAVNPNKKPDTDTRTPAELIEIIEAKGREISEALGSLRQVKL